MSVPRDFRWDDVPGPDPDTGRAPLAPTPAAADVPALLAEADAWCADAARALRSGIVADLAEALRRAVELHRHDVFMVHTSDRARDEARRDQLAAITERDAARREVARLRQEHAERTAELARERDRLARRLRAVVAIGRGARVPDKLADASDAEPCGWTTR